MDLDKIRGYMNNSFLAKKVQHETVSQETEMIIAQDNYDAAYAKIKNEFNYDMSRGMDANDALTKYRQNVKMEKFRLGYKLKITSGQSTESIQKARNEFEAQIEKADWMNELQSLQDNIDKRESAKGMHVQMNILDEAGQFMSPEEWKKVASASGAIITSGGNLIHGTGGDYTAGFDPYEKEPDPEDSTLNENMIGDLIAIENLRKHE